MTVLYPAGASLGLLGLSDIAETANLNAANGAVDGKSGKRQAERVLGALDLVF